jgi:hypothetical protein
VLTGVLIAQEAYFTLLAGGSPLLSALQPASGLLGKEYAKQVSAEADQHLRIRATGADREGLWRISLNAVDGWTLGAAVGERKATRGRSRGSSALDSRAPAAGGSKPVRRSWRSPDGAPHAAPKPTSRKCESRVILHQARNV